MKPAVGFVLGLYGVIPDFWPPVDKFDEFEVEDILDSWFVHCGC